MTKRLIIYSVLVFLLNSCASFYRTMVPPTQVYNNNDLYGDVTLSYNYDVLSYSGNRKYARKEKRKDLRLVSIKVTNVSNHNVNFNDLKFVLGDSRLSLLNNQIMFEEVKQNPAWYLFYTLACFGARTIINPNGTSLTLIYFYPIRLLIPTGNIIVAATANGRFKRELIEYDLTSRVIKPNETVYGLISFHSNGYAQIKLEGEKKANTETIVNHTNDNANIPKKTTALYISEEDTSFFKMKEDTFSVYYNRIIEELVKDRSVVDYKLSTSNFGNGNLKFEGIKVRMDRRDYNPDFWFPIGIWRYYHSNGKIKQILSYNIRGEKNGICKEFDENGNLIKTEEYVLDKLKK